MSYEYVSKKAIDWVEKCVDKEYKNNPKRYKSYNENDGRLIASVKVARNINHYFIGINVDKINPNKFWFLAQADQYASRISNWYENDSFARRLSHKPNDKYYKDENWRITSSNY